MFDCWFLFVDLRFEHNIPSNTKWMYLQILKSEKSQIRAICWMCIIYIDVEPVKNSSGASFL
jgi:hypothetical protein